MWVVKKWVNTEKKYPSWFSGALEMGRTNTKITRGCKPRRVT